MKIEMYVQNSETEKIYDVSTLCNNITFESYLRGQAGKLTFTLQKDPNEILQLSNGSMVTFKVDDYEMFLGYIFTMGTDATETYRVTCYDQMRYLKNEEIYITQNMSASQIFEMICNEGEMKFKTVHPTSFIIPKYMHDKKSRYAIIEYGINQHLINQKEHCFVRDDFGTLKFSELKNEKTDIVIGDKSLLMNYIYEVSIDTDTFNEVKVYRENKKTEKRDVWIVKDSETQKKWGILRTLQEAKKEMNEAKIVELANNILKVKNRETKEMKLNSLGVKEFRGGTGFLLNIPRLDVLEYMWVENVSHTFQNDLHLMKMEVFVI